MLIHEAAKKAAGKGEIIRRKAWKNCGWEGESFYLKLSKEDTPMKLFPTGKYWNPTPDDLTADDWEVVE